MSLQIITNPGVEVSINSFPEIRIDEYNAGDSSLVFAVYERKRCWKGISPINGVVPTLWVEQFADGNRGTVSERMVRRLERIWRHRGRYRRIRRFFRNDQEGERLLNDLSAAHSSGNSTNAFDLLQQFKKHLQSSPVLEGALSSNKAWDAIPQFDPNLVKKTKWLISSFLAEGTIQLVYGERGSYKTTFLLAAAKAVANGEEFLGMKTRRRRVLVLDYENPASIIKARNDDLSLGLEENENLKVWDRFGPQPTPRPEDPRVEEIVKECVAETGHGPWIIFDSWASLLKSGEGGEFTGQIAPIYLQLRKLADAGATVTVIDHTRKHDKNSLYGGQDKEAKADSIHNLVVFPNEAVPNNPTIRVESWLKRSAPLGVGSFAFEVQSMQDEKRHWHLAALVPVEDPAEKRKVRNVEILCNLIKKNPNSGQDALARLAAEQGIPREQASTLLKDGWGFR